MTFTDEEATALILAAHNADDLAWATGDFQSAAAALIAALSAAGFVIERDWRPIAEAPKDKPIDDALLYSPTDMLVVGCYIVDHGWMDYSGNSVEPTQFRPIDPPKEFPDAKA